MINRLQQFDKRELRRERAVLGEKVQGLSISTACLVNIDKTESKSQSKVQAPNPKNQIKEEKGNLDSGLSLKS